MKTLFSILCFCFLANNLFAQKTEYRLLNNSQHQTEIDITLGKVMQNFVQTINGQEVVIHIDKGHSLLSKGDPDVPKLSIPILIPNQKNSDVTIIESQYQDYPNIYVTSSKGILSRISDPGSIPNTYSQNYQKNEFFPSQIAVLNSPFIVRDFRGQTIQIHPVQYNPVSKILRVYSHLKIKVAYEGVSNNNTLTGQDSPEIIVEEYDGMYKNHFINYENSGTRYSPVLQTGSLLILSPAMFINEMMPFVKWKEMKGIKTFLVNTDTLTGGVNESTIKNIAKWYYQNKQIAYLLIVGDHNQIPALSSSGVAGPSDIAYAYISNNDHYPEFIVGRFSGESVEEIKTQVSRSMQYEKAPNTANNWMQTQIGVASSQGPGDDAQYDFEHIHNIVDSNKNQYYYLNNIEQYDGTLPQAGTDIAGNPDSFMFKNAVSAGASLINYCGHGNTFGINTTQFSSTFVPALSNKQMLPFMLVVGCRPGNFTTTTCFAETLQRQNNGSDDLGTISSFMSTIDQYWYAPMQAQDEFNAILRGARPSNQKQRLGAMCIDACMSMNDQYNTFSDPLGGSDMTDTWVFFGDPTVSLYTKNEGQLSFTNDVHIQLNSTTFDVACPVNGTTIGLYYQGSLLATAISNGGNAHFNFPAITVLDTVFITATKQNYTPAFGYTEVVNWPNGVGNFSSDNALSVYPNPATDFIQLSLHDQSQINQVHISDVGGRSFMNQQINKSSLSIPIKNYASGIYLLTVSSGERQFRRTFVKK